MTDLSSSAGVKKWTDATSWIPKLGRRATNSGLNDVLSRLPATLRGKTKKMIAGLTENEVCGALQDVLTGTADIHDAEHDDVVRGPATRRSMDGSAPFAEDMPMRNSAVLRVGAFLAERVPRVDLQKSSDRFRCINAPMFCH